MKYVFRVTCYYRDLSVRNFNHSNLFSAMTGFVTAKTKKDVTRAELWVKIADTNEANHD